MSFDIDMDSLLAGAASMFNALWPAFAIAVGLAIGIKLVTMIRSEITGSF